MSNEEIIIEVEPNYYCMFEAPFEIDYNKLEELGYSEELSAFSECEQSATCFVKEIEGDKYNLGFLVIFTNGYIEPVCLRRCELWKEKIDDEIKNIRKVSGQK